MTSDYIALKWGVLKWYEFNNNSVCLELLEQYLKLVESENPQLSVKQQLICSMIDNANLKEVYLAFDERWVSKEKAKKYVMGYNHTS